MTKLIGRAYVTPLKTTWLVEIETDCRIGWPLVDCGDPGMAHKCADLLNEWRKSFSLAEINAEMQKEVDRD